MTDYLALAEEFEFDDEPVEEPDDCDESYTEDLRYESEF